MKITLDMINSFMDKLNDQFDLNIDKDENRLVRFYPATEKLLPLVLMLQSKYPNAALADNPSDAEVLLIQENDPDFESWSVTVREYDLIQELVWDAKADTLPWEVPHDFVPYNQKMLEEATYDLLSYLPDDEKRPGLLETPKRVAKAWAFWTGGYDQKPEEILKVFEDGAEGSDEMVVVRDIPLYSKCEHHLADIFGHVDIAYIPNGKVVGLSKLSRVVDVYARRLQVQERLTNQIADALYKHLDAIGVGVVVRARHMCMESRGIRQQGHHTVTSALRGVIREDASARAEFLQLIRSEKGI
jgi:GTP cyclohydrolase I